MPPISTGLLLYRRHAGSLQVLLVHPGGPFFRNKDAGSWTIPKGEPLPNEDPLAAARREFSEETGVEPTGNFLPLNPVKQTSGKIVHAWAVEGDLDPTTIQSNTFTLEWPPKSGKLATFPEIDRAEFFTMAVAKTKILPAQVPLLEQLETMMSR